MTKGFVSPPHPITPSPTHERSPSSKPLIEAPSSPSAGRKMSKRVPQPTVLRHSILIEAPEVVAGMLDDFLAGRLRDS